MTISKWSLEEQFAPKSSLSLSIVHRRLSIIIVQSSVHKTLLCPDFCQEVRSNTFDESIVGTESWKCRRFIHDRMVARVLFSPARTGENGRSLLWQGAVACLHSMEITMTVCLPADLSRRAELNGCESCVQCFGGRNQSKRSIYEEDRILWRSCGERQICFW